MKQVLDEILEKLPEEYNMAELMGKAEDRTPYTVVALQECDRMNTLTNEMKISLKELDLGLKVNTFTLLWIEGSYFVCLRKSNKDFKKR